MTNVGERILEDRPALQRHPPYDLGLEFACNAKGWSVDWNEFTRRHPGIWYSADGEGRRSIQNGGVTFFGYAVCDNTLVFGEGGLEKIEISVFNKGDAGALLFEADALEAVKRASEHVVADKMDVSTADDGAGKSITRYDWIGSYPAVRAVMGECLQAGERCVEYLNFSIETGTARPVKASGSPRDNVRRSGCDVYIDGIPMVNQGRKGYCVPATISRILKYYGIDADMHDLALVMETECGGGTTIGGDFPTLNRIASETGLSRTDYRGFARHDDAFWERYNAAARSCGGRELKIEDFTVEETDADGHVVNMRHYDWMAKEIEDELERKSRHYDREGFARFKAGIVASVDNGYPLLWSVDRLFPWDRRDGSSGSGHMRLVVGYNAATDEVLYSDSWGSGNEFKRASMSEAWEVTDFMSCLSPSR